MINPQLLIFQAFFISSLHWLESWMINPLLTLPSAMGFAWLLSRVVFAIGFLGFLYIELHAWVIFSSSRSACLWIELQWNTALEMHSLYC